MGGLFSKQVYIGYCAYLTRQTTKSVKRQELEIFSFIIKYLYTPTVTTIYDNVMLSSHGRR